MPFLSLTTKGNTKYREILVKNWEVNSTSDYYNKTMICRSDLHSESTTTVCYAEFLLKMMSQGFESLHSMFTHTTLVLLCNRY